MLVSQKIIFLSLFLLHFYLPGSGGWEPLLAFMQALSERHAQRVCHGAVQLSCSLSPCSVTVHVCPRVLSPTLCVCHQSEDTAAETRKCWTEAIKLQLSNPEERAPPEGKNGDLWLFKLLNFACARIAFQKRAPFCYTGSVLSPKPRKRQHRTQGVLLQRSKPKCKWLHWRCGGSPACRPGTGMCWEWQEGDFLGTLLRGSQGFQWHDGHCLCCVILVRTLFLI